MPYVAFEIDTLLLLAKRTFCSVAKMTAGTGQVSAKTTERFAGSDSNSHARGVDGGRAGIAEWFDRECYMPHAGWSGFPALLLCLCYMCFVNVLNMCGALFLMLREQLSPKAFESRATVGFDGLSAAVR